MWEVNQSFSASHRHSSWFSFDQNDVPAGSQCHLKLAMTMQENVNDSPGLYFGPQPEGSMEGQVCVCVCVCV